MPKVTQGVKGRTRPCPRPRVPQILLLFTPRGLTMGDFERLQKGLEESLRDPPRSGGRLDRAHIPSWEGSATLLSLGNNRTNSSAQVYLLSVAPQSLDSGWGLPPNPQRGRP